MQHVVQKHGGQMLLPDSVGQLRWLVQLLRKRRSSPPRTEDSPGMRKLRPAVWQLVNNSRCVVCRYATAWAVSLEGAVSGRQSWALLCRFRCRLLLAESRKVSTGTRN